MRQSRSYDAVDLFKWICAWFVMYIHMAPVFPDAPIMDRVISQGLCRIAVPFFFAVSAFLLFRSIEDSKSDEPANRKVLWKYCARLLAVYTLWQVVYAVYYAFYNDYNGLPQNTVLDYVYEYFFEGGQMHLRYLMATVYAVPLVYTLWKAGRNVLIGGFVVCEVLCWLDWPYCVFPVYDNPVGQLLLKSFPLFVNAIINAVPMMCIGILCLSEHEKCSNRQWLVRLLVAVVLFVAEVTGLFLYFGQTYSASGMITRGLLIYCLVNWLCTVDYHLPVPWLGKALRLSSTWIYCAHYLVLMLFHWVFAYQGITRYVLVGGLTVVSGIPYVAWNMLKPKRKHVADENCGYGVR